MTISTAMLRKLYLSVVLSSLGNSSAVLAQEVLLPVWSAQTANDGSTLPGCALMTPKIQLEDGQGQTTLWLELTSNQLTVKTKSAIDTEFKDIGLKVDDQPFHPFDELSGKNDVVFNKDVDSLIKAFIHGQKVYITLRFWPTWPTTGVKTAEFSLIGFTKAYEAAGCKSSSINSTNSSTSNPKAEPSIEAPKAKESSKPDQEKIL